MSKLNVVKSSVNKANAVSECLEKSYVMILGIAQACLPDGLCAMIHKYSDIQHHVKYLTIFTVYTEFQKETLALQAPSKNQ